MFYRINASLADINISYFQNYSVLEPDSLCYSLGSYTTSSCLLVLESELLLYFSGISLVCTSTENSLLLLL